MFTIAIHEEKRPLDLMKKCLMVKNFGKKPLPLGAYPDILFTIGNLQGKTVPYWNWEQPSKKIPLNYEIFPTKTSEFSEKSISKKEIFREK